ncbi:MAG: methylenetetrahydrofolate reductase [Desulfurococcales archaeon]|nr:methylenetetrahydrofolate reductase [Desulfurococcales archaeon]
MEVYPELEPSRDRRVIMNRLETLIKIYNGRVDIPDIPLGKPSISSPVISVYARHRLGADVIAHLRVVDHNLLSTKSIIKTLSYVGVRKLVLLRGDPPRQGEICNNYMQPEEAVAYAKKYGVEAGLLISPRRTDEEIMSRLSAQADIYYITRLSEDNFERIEHIGRLIRESGSRVGVYVVVATARNREYLHANKIPSVRAENLDKVLERVAGWADRAILSAPGDGDALAREIAGVIRRWI